MLNDGFTVDIGTTNKLNPQAIYLNGKAFIRPVTDKDDYDDDITDIRYNLKRNIAKALKKTTIFEPKFILNFDIASNRMVNGKRSFLSFQIVLKQKKDNIMKLNDVRDIGEPFVHDIVFSLENDIIMHDFTIHKRRK